MTMSAWSDLKPLDLQHGWGAMFMDFRGIRSFFLSFFGFLFSFLKSFFRFCFGQKYPLSAAVKIKCSPGGENLTS